jgi:hypothetical protein
VIGYFLSAPSWVWALTNEELNEAEFHLVMKSASKFLWDLHRHTRSVSVKVLPEPQSGAVKNGAH